MFISEKALRIIKRDVESGKLARVAKTPAGKRAIAEGEERAIDSFANIKK